MIRIKMPRTIDWLVILHAMILFVAVVFLVRQKGRPLPDKEKIVILPIEGMISHQAGSLRGSSVESLVATINGLKDKEDVKAVVLRINSPGGSIAAVQDIYGALKKLKSKGKVIVSSFGDVSASGGYYIASLSDQIYCQPGTLTGSIGVILQLPNFQGLLSKIGVSFVTIKSGDLKDSGSPFRPMTDQERAVFTEAMRTAFNQFYLAVKEGRKFDDATLRPLADGRVFLGETAFEKKLVDGLGGLDDAVESAKKLTGLEKKDPVVITHREKASLEKLLNMFSSSSVKDIVETAAGAPQLLYLLR